MPLMEWNEKLAVGVALLDADHHKMVGMINDLYDAIKTGNSKEVLGLILDRLVNYTRFHFSHEEQFFARTNYPEAAAGTRFPHKTGTGDPGQVQKREHRHFVA